MVQTERGSLVYRYHDGLLVGCAFGPRREIVLDIVLNPVRYPQGPRTVALRFGAVENLDEVVAAFRRAREALPDPRAVEQIDDISRLDSRSWAVDLDHAGRVTIRTAKMPREL